MIVTGWGAVAKPSCVLVWQLVSYRFKIVTNIIVRSM